MQNETSPIVPDMIAADRAAPSGEHAPAESAADQPRRGIAPASLVPALTLVALQFVTADHGSFNALLLSIGSGAHRP